MKASVGRRLSSGLPCAAERAKSRTVGAAEGSIIAIIMIHHIASVMLKRSMLHEATIGFIVIPDIMRSEEHTSELQSLMRISYAVFCVKKTNKHHIRNIR